MLNLRLDYYDTINMKKDSKFIEEKCKQAKQLGQLIRYVGKARAKKLRKRGNDVFYDFEENSYVWFMRRPLKKFETITEEIFLKYVGQAPIQDDLERCNCVKAGQSGHASCGWNYFKNLPMFMSSQTS